jgi:hypothetical protein
MHVSTRLRYAAAAAAATALIGVGVVAAGMGHAAPGGLPVPVDGIQCQASEQVLFHVHSHLAIVDNGHPLPLPEGIGIAAPQQVANTAQGPFVVGGACFSWLHTHARDGIIHIESPVERPYTLGQFFDIWRQPLGRDRVAGARGRVTAFVDGRRFLGDPRTIALGAHRVIQLDVGRRVPPAAFGFPAGL